MRGCHGWKISTAATATASLTGTAHGSMRFSTRIFSETGVCALEFLTHPKAGIHESCNVELCVMHTRRGFRALGRLPRIQSVAIIGCYGVRDPTTRVFACHPHVKVITKALILA